jgi:tetratricopeptide (TPR) repeat protein
LAAAVLVASLLAQAKSVAAANSPQIGPVPSWVAETPAVPAEKEDIKDLPLTILVNDTQFSFDADGWTEYRVVRAKVQAPEGLQSLGAIPFQWSPWSDTLTFHRARILRDGQAIDVLPKDGVFTVLRRETGLEQAMLTGELTAVLQPEGMQVGDVLEIALSIRHADPLLKGQTAAMLSGWDQAPVGHMRLQAHWPSSLPMRWRETSGLPPLKRSEAGGVTTVSLDLQDVRPPILPAHAPPRFQHGREIEFSTLADWAGVARVMKPLYIEAAKLAPGSPLMAQAKSIADASTDPKARAAAALRLVQEKVRYLAHTEDAGGYTPQSADETWRLRYGDCKAKTALLLALLRELGVPAEPVLASTTGGDGLDAHLPSALVFNHVLVRVKLGTRDYWLDGARQGDRSLDDAPTPAFGWVLPLGEENARLVRIAPAPPSTPMMVQEIRYDASGGVTAPEPTQLKTTFRGDAGIILHARLAAVVPDQLQAALRGFWASVHTAFTPAHMAAAWDPATGEEILTADGTSKLDWSESGLELEHVALGGAPDIKRDPASNDPDAPYVVDYPGYDETDESVVMPSASSPNPDSVKAAEVDTTIAGVAYRRTASLTGKVLRVVASRRSLQPEISAAEARASVDPLTKLGELTVYASERTATAVEAIDSHPTTLEGRLRRGQALLDAARYREAFAEFDAAVALDPKSATAWGERAIARAWLADPAATADADKADALGPPGVAAAAARGLLAANTGDMDGARAAYRHALTLSPNDLFVLEHLFDLEVRTANPDAARQILDQLLKAHPETAVDTHFYRASLEMAARHKQAAEQELAQAPVATSKALLYRARIYLGLGDEDLAKKDADAAIRLEPTAAAWLVRAAADGGLGSSAAAGDVDAALRISADDWDALRWRLSAARMRRDFVAALPMADALLRAHPENGGGVLLIRAQIERDLGRIADADADLVKARAVTGAAAARPDQLCAWELDMKWRPEVALADCEKAVQDYPKAVELGLDRVVLLHRLGREAEAEAALDSLETANRNAIALNNICYSLAVEGEKLDHALSDCDSSLKLMPTNANILDSRAFVLMRLGRDAEAVAAYDAALAADPKLPTSLYGRGFVEARLGRAGDSARDMNAALALAPHIREDFAKLGLAAAESRAVSPPASP